MLAGAPFHDFKKTSAEPIPSGQAVQVRFQLMPTAYTFAKVQSEPTSLPQSTPSQLQTSYVCLALASLSFVHLPVKTMQRPC